MRMSQLFGDRFKEKPADAFLSSHIFLLRGGYIRQVANGIFSLLPPAKRVVRKIEAIIREEMDKVDGQEVLFPVAMPAELWQESGRYDAIGSELLRFTDRTGHGMVLGMTHEEAAVHLARTEAKTYLKYPFMIYQIQTKFRDEPRARGGLIRVREFTMKDACSFHTSLADLEQYYSRMLEAYNRIYQRVGLGNVLAIQSDTGMMGGKVAHEFMYLSEGGEDSIVICPECGYQSNMEVAESHFKAVCGAKEEGALTPVQTPDTKDIEALCGLLGCKAEETVKAVIFARAEGGKPVVAFIRGDLQVNESKLSKIVRSELMPFTDWASSPLCFGFIGPVGLPEGAEVVYDCSLRDGINLVCGGNQEDTHFTGLSVPRDLPETSFSDIAKVEEGDCCVHCGAGLTIKRGIEVGNIFQLGDKYTQSMKMTYTDENGKLQTPIMGCYGIGVGRLLACILEEHHDDYGAIWPKEVAPWQVQISVINNSMPEIREAGEKLYLKISEEFETIYEDRDLSAGAQFADADLIGAPVRVVVSKRNLAEGMVEIATRDKTTKLMVPVENALEAVKKLLF